MKIVCVGGGPSGLYFSLLVKKARPDADVTVIERNPEGVTFGWGVVFSDETLSYLEENDPKSHEAIEAAFAHWTAIDIHYRGEVLRSDGHGFSGIARKTLLQILEARAREVGVRLVFGENVDAASFETLTQGADLIVGSDGVRSGVRERFSEAFGPSSDVRTARYIWLGTNKLFDAFTFYFQENEHGIFNVHGYRFDRETSTFIVECDEATFEAAGLAGKTTEESIAYLERLFAHQLGEARLFANKSSWVQFVTMKCERWHHENIVLLGDAAHTAHFSIGSGTKLAMEDAIALVEAIREHVPTGPTPRRGDITRALIAYEEARRPIVERTQKAAQDSLLWFENVKRYRKLPPSQFAFSLLTRSKRITYENLRMRDEAFVAHVRSEHHLRTQDVARTPETPPMFRPFSLRGLTLPNRVVVSPMCMYSAHEGVPNDFHFSHYAARAMGGAGLLMTEMTDVTAEGRISPGCTGLYERAQVDAWKRIVSFVHAQSHAKVGVQLGHAGRKGSTRVMWEGSDRPLAEGNWPLLSASPIPYLPESQVPREMSRADMDAVKAAFVRSAAWAEEAGFDLIELHMAHGYLLASFLSPLTNVRTDEYGGSCEARMRYPLEVFEAVRAVWPSHKPMSVRISATDWIEGGVRDADILALARALKERGCDVIDTSAGLTTPLSRPKFYGRMYQAYWSDMIRNEVGIPTIAVGGIASGDHVNTLVLSGRADLCALARPHLANPHFTMTAAIEQGYRGEAVGWPAPYGMAKPPAVVPLASPRARS